MGRDTKINYRSVYRYAKKLRDGDVVREKAGRPPLLDNTARDALLILFQSGEEPLLSILLEKMKEEREKMLRRTNPNITEDELEKDIKKKITKASAKRYLKILKMTLSERERKDYTCID